MPAKMEEVAHHVAERVEEGAKARVAVRTGALRESIHIEHDGPGEYRVVAGDDKVFWGMLVEHGTIHIPARPFLIPAEEEVRPQVHAIGAAALMNL